MTSGNLRSRKRAYLCGWAKNGPYPVYSARPKMRAACAVRVSEAFENRESTLTAARVAQAKTLTEKLSILQNTMYKYLKSIRAQQT